MRGYSEFPRLFRAPHKEWTGGVRRARRGQVRLGIIGPGHSVTVPRGCIGRALWPK